MFWKKKEPKEKETVQQEKPKSIKERVIGEVGQLTSGQNLIYKLPEKEWGFAAFLIIELNPSYPEKGKKYIVSRDSIADGQPAGQKERVFEIDKPSNFVGLVMDRNAERFSLTQKTAITKEQG